MTKRECLGSRYAEIEGGTFVVTNPPAYSLNDMAMQHSGSSYLRMFLGPLLLTCIDFNPNMDK